MNQWAVRSAHWRKNLIKFYTVNYSSIYLAAYLRLTSLGDFRHQFLEFNENFFHYGGIVPILHP